MIDASATRITYVLNAVGSVVQPQGFRDPRDESALKQVEPNDITGNPPRPGYAVVFPEVSQLWNENGNAGLLKLIRLLHNYSKHRAILFGGGAFDVDQSAVSTQGWRYKWWKEIVLYTPTGTPVPDRYRASNGSTLLEPIVAHYAELVEVTGTAACRDTEKNVVPHCTPRPTE